MKLQYLEIFRHGERIYQGIALGDKDAQKQMASVAEGASSNNQELVWQTNTSWEIINIDSREPWGKVTLREF